MSGKRILVVDDSTQVRSFLAEVLLPSEGYQVAVAASGEEGYATALANPPDLIITDFAMPERSGLEMVADLRDAGQTIPVILMTAEGSEAIAVSALRLGVADYFIKPFDPEEMLDSIRRILASARPVASAPPPADTKSPGSLFPALRAAGRELTGSEDIDVALGSVLRSAVALTAAESSALYLYSTETRELRASAGHNLPDGWLGERLPVKGTAYEQALKSGQSLHLTGDAVRRASTTHPADDLIITPLVTGDRPFGVLEIRRTAKAPPLNTEAMEAVGVLAAYVAILFAQTFAGGLSTRTLAAIDEPVLLLDRESRVMMRNVAARELLGQDGTGDLPVGVRLGDVVENPQLIELIDCAQRGETTHAEIPLRNGKIYMARTAKVSGLGLAFVLSDITSLKEVDRFKTEIIEMVSHQVRSPLTAILSYIEFLQRTGNLNPNQLEFAYQVRRNVKLITDTINDLLDLGKIEAGADRTRESVDLAETVSYVVDALRNRAEAKEQKLVSDVKVNGSLVQGNGIQLRQAFVNLIENAIKYTPVHGEIAISLIEEGGQIVARIRDSGIGIPVEEQNRIFDRFYRASTVSSSYEGTGLGLSIVKSIVEAHDGRIWVDSRMGEGTTFTVMLPVTSATTVT